MAAIRRRRRRRSLATGRIFSFPSSSSSSPLLKTTTPSLLPILVLIVLGLSSRSSILPCSSAIKFSPVFLSGVAETTQLYYPGSSTGIKRYHLVCFHRGGSSYDDNNNNNNNNNHHKPYAATVEQGREKCCNELRQNGLIREEGEEDWQSCLDHIATVPNVATDRPDISNNNNNNNNKKKKRPRGMGKRASKEGEDRNDNDNNDDDAARPAFYLAQDGYALHKKRKNAAFKSYEQSRHLQVYADGEKERLSDKEMGKVEAYSPFHLTGFIASDGPDGKKRNKNKNGGGGGGVLPLIGSVRGTLSDDGGMHRAFRHRVLLTMHTIPQAAGNSTAAAGSSNNNNNYRLTINATILLPIMESAFVDADDPFIVEYGKNGSGSPEGISCRATIDNKHIILRKGSGAPECSMEFVPAETIDVEQPAFASRQYVVAYRVSATLDLTLERPTTTTNAAGSGMRRRMRKELEVAVDYGTTLHLRYPAPTLAEYGLGPSAPAVVPRPVLYSASASFIEEEDDDATATDDADDDTSNAKYYALRRTAEVPPEPIIIRVAAGLDDDYWWVTAVTMSAALIGGLMLIRSLDSVSMWC